MTTTIQPELIDKVRRAVDEVLPQIVALRHELHQEPEIGAETPAPADLGGAMGVMSGMAVIDPVVQDQLRDVARERLSRILVWLRDAGVRVRPLDYPVPTFPFYFTQGQIENAPLVEVPAGEDFSLPIDKLAAADAALTFVANPNSPTGATATVEQLVRACLKKGA